uniref:Uncharacterized protein n=1 Tax=Anguilla anguilla TaxID=7936 RepID=A0A0E9TM81_ANGAN
MCICFCSKCLTCRNIVLKVQPAMSFLKPFSTF